MLSGYELDLYFLKCEVVFNDLLSNDIKYNFLLSKCFKHMNNKLNNNDLYISLKNLITEKQNLVAWNGILKGYDIYDNIKDIIDLYNAGYSKSYISNMYHVWNILRKNNIHKNKKLFVVILSFSFSYYYYLLHKKSSKIIFIPFIWQALNDIDEDNFLLFLNRLIEINSSQANHYLTIENLFFDNFKRRTSNESLQDIFNSFIDNKGIVYVKDVVERTQVSTSYINKFFKQLSTSDNPIIRRIEEQSTKNSVKYRIEYIALLQFYKEEVTHHDTTK